MQRSMTTVRPFSLAYEAASSFITPDCIHSTFAPAATASLAVGMTFSLRRNTSTMSTGSPISSTDWYGFSPNTGPLRLGLTGKILKPKSCKERAIEWLVRYGLSESPTTATLRDPLRRALIFSTLGFSCIASSFLLRRMLPDLDAHRRAPCPSPRPSPPALGRRGAGSHSFCTPTTLLGVFSPSHKGASYGSGSMGEAHGRVARDEDLRHGPPGGGGTEAQRHGGVDKGRPGPLPASVGLGHRLYSRRARAPRYQLLARAGLAGSVVTPLEVNPWGGEQGQIGRAHV